MYMSQDVARAALDLINEVYTACASDENPKQSLKSLANVYARYRPDLVILADYAVKKLGRPELYRRIDVTEKSK